MNVDRIFDTPVELAAKIFRIPAEERVEGDRSYDRFAAGVYWGEAGGLLALGGLAAGAVGLEVGGAVMAYGGLLRVIANSGNIKRQVM